MGRRPNQLVSDYFVRGKKLEDASNRYEHNCRKCGQLIEKGRIDALVGHLLRRCPNLAQADHAAILHHLHRDPSAPSKQKIGTTGPPASKASVFAPSVPFSVSFTDFAMTDEVKDAFPHLNQYSALNTLAEVSGQHLNYTAQLPLQAFEQRQADDAPTTAEQAFVLQLQNVAEPVATSCDLVEDARAGPATAISDATSARSAFYQSDSPAVGAQAGDTYIDPQLRHTDNQLLDFNSNDDLLAADDTMTWRPLSPKGHLVLDGSAAPEDKLSAGFGLLRKRHVPKARGHFTDSRRKEVQEVRKRGACIRCRMLKKPCSEGTPCNTCAHVQSARLWKGKCLRTKLADEMGLWSAKLFTLTARAEVSAAVRGLKKHAGYGQIEARFTTVSDLSMRLAIKQYSSVSYFDDTKALNVNLVGEEVLPTIWVVDETEGFAEKIGQYVARLAEADLIGCDTSALMKTTIRHAQSIISDEHANFVNDPNPKTSSGRSCYNLQSQLLRDTIELSAATILLSGASGSSLILRYEPVDASSDDPSRTALAPTDSLAIRPLRPGSRTHRLIEAQILAVVESRCAVLAKGIINELERRLMQRQQVSRFATFVSAIMLLASVERMTGLYRRFSTDGKDPTRPADPDWALYNHPGSMWPQGERFSELLTTLLRMRALLPPTARAGDGTLKFDMDHQNPAQSDGAWPHSEKDEQLKMAAAWLDDARLMVGGLEARRDAGIPGPEACPSDWDLRFLSRLLLPE
ncbi:hypothetical protein BAUCODRAFT_29620 [Baudoinia panamericana UAMH 10762]|uniref:Zn(2)-C6 fungal-type domain-containing protein n=1 Tax=Baudoinia panamericana (strain UAMH 10762) TaxID=717646 RepID=M2MW33_BAUPA|nr:uncharacterized protein BAUCODRAFT_29620 [Baudoinia panamericana UAMH 10762]EMD01187.1 hypothetical protein BAUCODRAFT_29620 [Baudoinia panamericana UAMH 10762]